MTVFARKSATIAPTPRSFQKRRGMVFWVVMSVVTIMAIFILFYHNFSKQLAFSSFYHVNREKLRNLTEIMLDSAFSNLQNVTRDPGHDLTKKIIEQMRTAAISNTAFALPAPLFDANKESLLNGAALKYTLTGRVFDKRIQTPQNQKYHDGEGLGTLEIFVDATLETPSGKLLARCQRRRHFDFKSACLVSNYNKRANYYAMTFPLDFALLIRNGLREFNEGYRGLNINAGQKLIIQDQSSIPVDRRGFVYFGQADQNEESKRVFLNTSDSDNADALMPQIPVETFNINQEECFKLLPELKQNLEANEVKISKLKNLNGVFSMRRFPAARTGTPDNREKEARNVLSAAPGSPDKVIPQNPSGISFAGPVDKSYLDTILRGAITQRWLYVVHFALDASSTTYDGSPLPPEGKEKFESLQFVCYSPETPRLKDGSNPQHLDFCKRLETTINNTNPPLPLYSNLVEDYLMYQGQQYSKNPVTETFKAPPKFFGRNSSPLSDLTMTGGEGFRPFRHYTLCAARYLHASELEKNGVYDRKNGVLNLRGVVSVELDHVSLNPPAGSDHLKIKGAGAIIAPNGFTINCGLKREDPAKDLLILFTRKGNIRVGTDAQIEASLLAFNDSNTGAIVPSKPLNVLGSVGVDQLFLSRFPSSPGHIQYDQRLKAATDNDEIFALTVSPWVRYEDISFAKE